MVEEVVQRVDGVGGIGAEDVVELTVVAAPTEFLVKFPDDETLNGAESALFRGVIDPDGRRQQEVANSLDQARLDFAAGSEAEIAQFCNGGLGTGRNGPGRLEKADDVIGKRFCLGVFRRIIVRVTKFRFRIGIDLSFLCNGFCSPGCGKLFIHVRFVVVGRSGPRKISASSRASTSA